MSCTGHSIDKRVYVVSVMVPLLDNFLGLKQMLRVLAPLGWCELYKGISVEKTCEFDPQEKIDY